MGTKVLVIGLDGATPELLERWVEQGNLPHLKGMMRHGVYGKLKSTYPPISPAAWTTFATGHNPGKHGTFDFRNYDPRRYGGFADTVVDSRPLAGKTIWDLVGASGQRVGAVTVPVTYPAWQVNGFMVSGYPTPDAAKSFAYPPDWGERIPPLTEDSTFFKSAPHDKVLNELVRITHLRTDVSIAELARDDYGLFILVIGATDRAHHDWWQFMDPDHPAYDARQAELYGDYILQVYQTADVCVGKLLAAVGDDTTVVVLSDHGGMAHPKWYFNTNGWLRGLGLLRPTAVSGGIRARLVNLGKHVYGTRVRRLPNLERLYRVLPARLKHLATNLDAQATMNLDAIDWPCTSAYRFPMYPPVEGVMLNVIGRQPEGCVRPGAEYEDLRAHILEEARSLRDPRTGEPIVVEAYRREDLYHGERLDTAPDLVLVTRDSYKGGSGLDEVVSDVPLGVLSKLSGVHRMDGILLAQGPHLRRDVRIEQAAIIDVAPTILYLLGLRIPTDMDGKPLVGLFDPAFTAQRAATYADERAYEVGIGTGNGYTQEEEESVRLKLEALGYL
jgi:predicted AlkP superfamily phosphohydrolase/phosphomutase